MKGKFPNNLQKFMTEAEVGPTELARKFGTSKQNIARWADASRALPPEWAKRLARHFGVPPGAMYFDDDEVRVVGYVGAGSEAHYYSGADDPNETAAAPPKRTDNTVGVIIRGDSLGTAFNGWVAYYDNVRNPVTDDLFFALCVCGLEDDRVLIKRIKPAATKGLFHLESNAGGDQINDVAVRWAARVTAVLPKR